MLARLLSSAFVAAAALATSGSGSHEGAAPDVELARGPVLVIGSEQADSPSSRSDDARGGDEIAASLAVASLTPEERVRVLEQMAYTAARLEARLAPLLAVDFGDDEVEPIDELRRAMAVHVPSFTAARAFERGSWRMDGLAARVARSCAEAKVAPDEICAPLWSDDSTRGSGSGGAAGLSAHASKLRRARFLAWAASRAAVVELEEPSAAKACAHALRPLASDPTSTIALVLTSDDLELRPVAEHTELEDAALRLGRAMAANHVAEEKSLEALERPGAARRPGARVASWLSVGPRMLVVVPRMSALTRIGDLAPAIERACSGAPLRWIHRP